MAMKLAALLIVVGVAALQAQAQSTTQCHYDCYNFKGSVTDGEALKTNAVNSCKSNNVTGTPTFSSGSSYFQSHANAAPEQGCTISACTPFGGSGYSPAYTACEHATAYWKALTAPSNTTSNATRANANVPCTGCPSS